MIELPKILCIDDEPHALDALERALRRDFHVLKAVTGEQARKALQANPDIAVVLSDQRMPSISGLTLLNEFRQQAPEAVRALLSGQIELHDMMEAVNSGLIHRLILKPWDTDYLRLQMLEALKSHTILQEKNRLEHLAITDPITQLYNHRYFQDALKIEMDRASRHGRELTMVMADIDHFKKFNDQYGHPAGDKILTLVARRLLEQVRNLDIVTRYGGEEFAVIMPDTGPAKGLTVTERVRSSFEQTPFNGPQSRPVYVTISLGVACFPKNGDTPADLISAADQALYQAKRQGRNQSVVAAT